MNDKKKFKRVLVANRGEIAIRIFRACKELGIRSVAIYSEEDKNTLFRTKADESYQIGKGKSPVDAYLAIDEIIELAKAKGVDAIHPGYGFLSENVEFAKACEEEGLVFIGPDYHMMDSLGDKVKSKIVANSVGVPTIPGGNRTFGRRRSAVCRRMRLSCYAESSSRRRWQRYAYRKIERRNGRAVPQRQERSEESLRY